MNELKLSKTLSHALRHEPEVYGLVLDVEGWVSIVDVLDAVHKVSGLENINRHDIELMMAQASKQRFEIKDDFIRAYYGHSVSHQIQYTELTPPDILYHGTNKDLLDRIMIQGLLPMNRQYVHLSSDLSTAIMVGKRKDKNPVILEIDARLAYEEGIKFYCTNDQVWLSKIIPSKYILGSLTDE